MTSAYILAESVQHLTPLEISSKIANANPMLSDFFMYSRECFLKILGVSKSRALQTLCCDRDISLLFFKLRSHNYSSSPHFFVRSSRNINCIHCGIYWLFQRTCNCSCTFSKVVDTTSKPHHDRSGCGSGENHVSRPELARAASSYDPARAARWLSYDWMPVTARAARWLRSKSHPAREGPLKGFFFRLKRQSSQQHAHGEFCIAVSQKLRSGSDWPLWCR